MPKVKVELQVLNGKGFRDVESEETDSSGRFTFRTQRSGQYRLVFSGFKGLCPVNIPVKYAKVGMKGIRLTLSAATTDTCPDYCESRVKIEEMTGHEPHE